MAVTTVMLSIMVIVLKTMVIRMTASNTDSTAIMKDILLAMGTWSIAETIVKGSKW